MQKLTKEQFEKLYGTQTVKQFSNIQPSGEIDGSKLFNPAKEAIQGLGTLYGGGEQGIANKLKTDIQAGASDIAQGNVLKGVVKAGARTAGDVAGAIYAPVSAAIQATGFNKLTDYLGKKIADMIPVSDIPAVQKFAMEHPNAGEDFGRALNLAMAKGETGKIDPKTVVSRTIEQFKTGADAVGGAIDSTTNAISDTIKPVTDVVGSVIDTGKLAVEGAMRIPERIGTNIAEKKAVQETIKALPTKTSQKAVQDGVDIRDVQTLNNIPKEQKQAVSKLVKNVQDFESGATKIDPMETVGKPFVNRLKTLQSEQARIGKQLGEVADNLGNVSEAEAFFPVYDALKTTRGLEGLKLADDGTLDFTNTVLATAETASDRSAIQSIFNDAVKASTGKQKHLLRQELRESLGGKKKAGVQITGTQESAYESIRRGLSNVLDNANSKYREVNAKYAKVSKPIDELVNLLKADKEGATDVLNLSAGILARRLTSAGIGNATVRRVLQLVDNATKVKGKTLTSVETLQDVMNVLSRYYDIAPRTGYKNLTQEALSGGIKDFVSTAVGDVAGKTDAVRKAALNKLLDELLSK
jgi:hypothetical protein